MTHTPRRTRRPGRRGFTLIEMMVVLTIILILVGLSVGAVMKAVNMQQRRNTEQSVKKIDQAFARQWKTVLDQARTEQIDLVNPLAITLAGTDGLAPNRARVIHTLMVLRREFPQTFAEAVQPAPANPAFKNQAFATALPPLATWGNYTPEQQSSVLLYLTLKQRRGGSDFDPDTALSPRELVDVLGNGIKQINDDWGRPIVYNRWPSAGYGAANLAGAQPFNPSAPADKEDPEGLLASLQWQTWLANTPGMLALFQANVGYPLVVPSRGAAYQYNLTPVIMSVGANGKYDLTDPGSDDIINFQL